MYCEKEDKKKYKDLSKYRFLNGVALHDLYHLNTELNEVMGKLFSDGIQKAIADRSFKNTICQKKDYYRTIPAVRLMDDLLSTDKNVFTTIQERRSIRKFKDSAVTLEQLSTILKSSCGKTGCYEKTEEWGEVDLYAYPSAGGLQSVQVYVLINNVIGVERGIYYYDALKNEIRLMKLLEQPYAHQKYSLCDGLTQNAAFIVYLAGSMDLVGYKYGDRGYRFMLLEAGHIAQNFLLTSCGIGIGSVASGGYCDQPIKQDFDIHDEYVLYEIIFGNIDFESKDYRL